MGSSPPVCQHRNRKTCVLVAFELSLSIVSRVSFSIVRLLNVSFSSIRWRLAV